MTPRKVIVTNWARLEAKYGKAGADEVKAAVEALSDLDFGNGLDAQVIDLEPLLKGAPFATTEAFEEANKIAIDEAVKPKDPRDPKAEAAFFVLIVGGPDIVPHQTLIHNVRDVDSTTPSDLPYACGTGYSRDPSTFINPIRAVGRLPDVTRGLAPDLSPRPLGSPRPLVDALHFAARPGKPVESFNTAIFSLCGSEFEKATGASLRAVMRAPAPAPVLLRTMPGGIAPPRWDRAQLKRHVHYFKCHGIEHSASFKEIVGGTEKAVFSSKDLLFDAAGVISGPFEGGPLVCIECCYGGQLFIPNGDDPENQPICNVYMAKGASGVFASTNAVWAGKNCSAMGDLITRTFLDLVLSGAPLGVAALGARRAFLADCGFLLDPISIKVLAQFILLGDPSRQPFLGTSICCAESLQGADAKFFDKSLMAEPGPARALGDGASPRSWEGWRVQRDQIAARAIARATVIPQSLPEDKTPTELTDALQEWFEGQGVKDWNVESFQSAEGVTRGIGEKPLFSDDVVHVALQYPDGAPSLASEVTLIRQRGDTTISVQHLVMVHGTGREVPAGTNEDFEVSDE
jgi:hypothetical protein